MPKVLVIAYYFPPLGWSGVQRTVKFVKYLPEFGWEPVVATVGETRFSIKDTTMDEEIPAGTEVIRVDDVFLKKFTDELKEKLISFLEPVFTLAGDQDLINKYMQKMDDLLEQLRQTVFIPDGCILWANNLLKEIGDQINMEQIDAIYTTSGPYSAHLVGYYLKERYDLPWVADFRDEWTTNPYIEYAPTEARFHLEKVLERKIIENADGIIANTPLALENFSTLYPINSHKMTYITNGYDEKDFTELQPVKNSKFTMVHNGSFYLARNPFLFLNAINHLIEQGLMDRERIDLQFIGYSEAKIRQETLTIDKYGLINWIEYLPHKECLNLTAGADLLLVIVGDKKAKAMIPAKIFEYLRLGKPILALAPDGSAVDILLKTTSQGKSMDQQDLVQIEEFILQNYRAWTNHTQKIIFNEKEVKKYERRRLTEQLADVLSKVIK